MVSGIMRGLVAKSSLAGSSSDLQKNLPARTHPGPARPLNAAANDQLDMLPLFGEVQVLEFEILHMLPELEDLGLLLVDPLL